jgi:CRP/FNR family transcriptional regulator, cyclic AMP receptor protein
MAEAEKRTFGKQLLLTVRRAPGSQRELVMGNTVITANRKSLPVEKKNASVATDKNRPAADWETLLTRISRGKTAIEYGAHDTIFVQGAPADSVLFLLRGKVELAVTSFEGKEAIVGTLSSGELFGEGCLAGQPLRMATAISVGDCNLIKVEKTIMARMLHEELGFGEMFAIHLLSRSMRYEADLVDQLFNSTEKRLARMLLLLSHFGKESRTETVAPGISQEHLAQMVGTTRSRINLFMNKFRKLGFVEYSRGEMTVHGGLRSVVLDD